MSHIHQDKKKLLQRIRRIQGQTAAIQKAIEQEQDCNDVLQLIAACRGAMNGLMALVLEGHVHLHLVHPNTKSSATTAEKEKAAQTLMDVIKTYLK